MEEFKYGQEKLDELFDKLKHDRRGDESQKAGEPTENREQRRQREKIERRVTKKQTA
jgi:hypothetical protein